MIEAIGVRRGPQTARDSLCGAGAARLQPGHITIIRRGRRQRKVSPGHDGLTGARIQPAVNLRMAVGVGDAARAVMVAGRDVHEAKAACIRGAKPSMSTTKKPLLRRSSRSSVI